MGRRHIWKPREVIRALKRLGFTQAPKRGKGDHLWFYKQVHCLGHQEHTIVTMVDQGVQEIPPSTMKYILDAVALDDETFHKVYQGDYNAQMYEAYLRTVPKDRLLPPAMRR